MCSYSMKVEVNTGLACVKMDRIIRKKTGIALFLVLGTILIVTILANLIVNLYYSNSRLTYHQTSRTKAYYATQAAINYAINRLQQGDANWTNPAGSTHTFCRNGCEVNETDLPSHYTINIIIGNSTTSGLPSTHTRSISATVDYTYTP